MHRSGRKDYRTVGRKDKVAVVVVGEASESDDDDDDDGYDDHEQLTTTTQDEKQTKLKESSVSSIDPQQCRTNVLNKQATNSQPTLSTQTLYGAPSSSANHRYLPDHSQANITLSTDLLDDADRNKDSLLHKLLKESNNQLKQNLINLSCTPYLTYSKDMGRITRQVITTHKLLQSGCALLHKTTNDINQLNKSFITLSNFLSTNKL